MWGDVQLSTCWALLTLERAAPHLSAIPTLTEWGLIIFGVVLLGFITWVFLRRRRAVVSLQ
jgi:LPXTG-motif cell wall-anchored protein